MIRWKSWHRWSALCLLACMYLAVAAALDRDAHAGLEIGLIPVTIPEMLRMLRGTVITTNYSCRNRARAIAVTPTPTSRRRVMAAPH